MDYQIHQPTGPLRRYVKALWSLDLEVPAGEEHTQRVAPNGCACLMIHVGDRPRVVGARGDRVAQLRGHVSGQKTTYTDLAVRGRVGMVAVILRPEAVGTVTGVPAHELRLAPVELGDLFGAAGRTLAEQVAERRGSHARFEHVQRFLLDHLTRTDARPDRCMSEVVRQVTHSGGGVRVRQLARTLGMSPRQLERKVAAAVGMSPKAFCRVVRYQKALSLKQHNPSLSLTALAHEAGYTDQPHFNREFRLLSGTTPSEAFAACPAFSDYYAFE